MMLGFKKHQIPMMFTTFIIKGNLKGRNDHDYDCIPLPDTSHDCITSCIYERPFGGIPFIMSCSEFAQLPALLNNMIFNKAPGSCGK